MKTIDWKPINGFEGYYINELGQVKSARSFKGTKELILKGSKNQQGNLVKKWDCITTIEKELGISVTSICNCCSGRSKKAGNYIWRYVNE